MPPAAGMIAHLEAGCVIEGLLCARVRLPRVHVHHVEVAGAQVHVHRAVPASQLLAMLHAQMCTYTHAHTCMTSAAAVGNNSVAVCMRAAAGSCGLPAQQVGDAPRHQDVQPAAHQRWGAQAVRLRACALLSRI